MTRKRIAFAVFVAVAAAMLLTVTFVPHHHHNGVLCTAEKQHECQTESDGQHDEDHSNCIEDEFFLTSRSESNQIQALPQAMHIFIAAFVGCLAEDFSLNNTEKDFGDLPPCIYKSAELSGTEALRAPPFPIA